MNLSQQLCFLPRFVYEPPNKESVAPFVHPDSREFHLDKLVKTMKRRWLRTIASERQNHFCCYCGRETNDIPEHKLQATLDHIVPQCQGGEDTIENTVMACAKCNRSRGSEDAFEYWKTRQKDFAGKNNCGNRVAGPS